MRVGTLTDEEIKSDIKSISDLLGNFERRDGNFTSTVRYGDVNGSAQIIDNMNYVYKPGNANQLDYINEYGDNAKGYKGENNSSQKYLYDINGNMTIDPHKGITIDYNHLDLAKQINWADGRKVKMTYDASGSVLKKEVLTATGGITHTTDYLGFVEFEDGAPYIIHHSEGRIVKRPAQLVSDNLTLAASEFSTHNYQALQNIHSSSLLSNGSNIDYEAGQEIRLTDGFNSDRGSDFRAYINASVGSGNLSSWVYEWVVTDHLGNLRLIYSDMDGNGSISASEITQSERYYPYGMKKSTNSTTLHKSNTTLV